MSNSLGALSAEAALPTACICSAQYKAAQHTVVRHVHLLLLHTDSLGDAIGAQKIAKYFSKERSTVIIRSGRDAICMLAHMYASHTYHRVVIFEQVIAMHDLQYSASSESAED